MNAIQVGNLYEPRGMLFGMARVLECLSESSNRGPGRRNVLLLILTSRLFLNLITSTTVQRRSDLWSRVYYAGKRRSLYPVVM